MYPQTLVKEYLDLKVVPYEHHAHPTAFTAKEVAAEEHVPGSIMAKTVVVKADHRFVMAVVSAMNNVNLEALKCALRAREVRLANEAEFKGLFPDSDVGAMPPFGNLYGIPVYVDASIASDPEIVFNAGTHQDTIRMKYEDFYRLVEPEIYSFALAPAA